MRHSQGNITLFKYLDQKKKNYLIVRKKRGRLIGEEKQALHRKIFDISGSVFNWYRENNKFLGEQKCYRNVLVIIFIIF